MGAVHEGWGGVMGEGHHMEDTDARQRVVNN